jgi:EAL domain-containing protein (putative c-di-GMP-specific phosphodiesterase class I)
MTQEEGRPETMTNDGSSLSAFFEPPQDDATGTSLRRMLHAIRTHLGMDVAFLGEFRGGCRVFRAVDTDLPDPPLREGEAAPLGETYCGLIAAGRLPELIRDPADHPEARALAVTEALPVGAHLSVPVRLADGTSYGTFCCFSLTPDRSLTDRDLALMRVFADMAAEQIDHERAADRAHDEALRRLDAALREGVLDTVYQPMVSLAELEPIGFEALARFSLRPSRPPEAVFAEAAAIGHGSEPELAAMEAALPLLRRLPRGLFLSLNVSPETILGTGLERTLDGSDAGRIVLEVTEHAVVEEYSRLIAALAPLRARGLRLAIDDAGAGHASFRHVVDMSPDIIKLDMGITRHIDSDRSRRAFAAALVGFARETEASIVAEGVEHEGELAVLRDLGIDAVQGYLLSRPMAADEAVAWAHAG